MAFPEWTEEHNQLREMVKDFAVRELAPHRYDWDKAGGFPRGVQADGGIGSFGDSIPRGARWFRIRLVVLCRFCRRIIMVP